LNDFEFIVGEQHYRCRWFVASCLSSRIPGRRAVDNTICEFSIATEDPKNEFSRFLSLDRGGSITVSPSDSSFYESLAEELLNEKLLLAVCEGITGDLTRENVFERLRRRHRSNFDILREGRFVASHFGDIGTPELKGLRLPTLSSILSSQDFKKKSDDWLYEWVWGLVPGDRSYFTLLQFVEFEFVSPAIAS
jgi:hypothetical protein